MYVKAVIACTAALLFLMYKDLYLYKPLSVSVGWTGLRCKNLWCHSVSKGSKHTGTINRLPSELCSSHVLFCAVYTILQYMGDVKL